MTKKNKTIQKFLRPHTFIKEYKYWYLTLRENQLTFGAMVLLAKSDSLMLSELDENSFLELKLIYSEIEAIFTNHFSASKFNYLTLMMTDIYVHMHIFPRYADKKNDFFWPGLIDLNSCMEISEEKSLEMVNRIRRLF